MVQQHLTQPSLRPDGVPPIEPAEAARPLIQAEGANSEPILTITHFTYGSPGALVPIKYLLCMGQVEWHSVAPFGFCFSQSLTGTSQILRTMAAV